VNGGGLFLLISSSTQTVFGRTCRAWLVCICTRRTGGCAVERLKWHRAAMNGVWRERNINGGGVVVTFLPVKVRLVSGRRGRWLFLRVAKLTHGKRYLCAYPVAGGMKRPLPHGWARQGTLVFDIAVPLISGMPLGVGLCPSKRLMRGGRTVTMWCFTSIFMLGKAACGVGAYFLLFEHFLAYRQAVQKNGKERAVATYLKAM